uniref:hypothetical protein n=1 Tax=Desulfogranum japonicum TaxID=231447 RepID=UPI0003F7D442|nr:hypothetical protein [Desulfogranum japonicum]
MNFSQQKAKRDRVIFSDEKKIMQVQAKLRKKEPEKTKLLIKLEKKLDNWIAQRSLA